MKAILATLVGGALFAAPLIGVASSASASVDGSGVVINEAYLKGGSASAPFNKKFVELYNPSDAAVSLDGWSLQYRSATGSGAANGVAPLSGTIAAEGYFLVQINGNAGTGAALPAPDLDVEGDINPSGTTGTLFLADTTAPLTPPTGSITGVADIVDLLGYGGSNTFEGALAVVDGPNGTPNSLARTGFVDTDNNGADFVSTGTVTPQNSGGATDPTDPTDPGDPTTYTIDELQGTGDVAATVTTKGIVTAAYGTGGFNGYYIQTPGTGGALDLATHKASDAIFVYSPSTAASVAVGDYVQVTGTVSEYFGLTQLTVTSAAGLVELTDDVDDVVPATVPLPADAAQRESLEGMLLAPQGAFTVSNTYSTNQYAEIGLASGTSPLLTPTEVARPGTPAYDAAVADNTARGVALDDGSSVNFIGADANKDIPLPFLTENPAITVGSKATFTSPVVFDYRNNAWKFQPTTQLTADGTSPVEFSNVRPAAPAEVGGDIQIAGFNVLNYFTTTGDSLSGCSYYTDRDGDAVTVSGGCDARGAAEAEDLERQQVKIVTAINGLDAEVVSLEEIENSVKFDKDRDTALRTLTDALNEDLGSDEWAFVPSPDADALPPVSSQDFIRTAFIYKKADVEPVGDSHVLVDSAFESARQPLAQEFKPAGGSDDDAFIAIVNHFKSKGSGSGENADQGDGQGASNKDRVEQANALVDFSDELQDELDTTDVFLIGDFNAYTLEDPAVAITDAGYVDQGSKTGKYTYSFSGQSGSLDHVYASPSADAKVSGVDIWNINSGESVALEYSRYNYNATDFYDESAYRSSDHDPVVVGYWFEEPPVELNLIDINDFHGRIDANTVKFAGTIEQLRAAGGEENSLFISSGDNIGASLFASSSGQDQPTIDVLNALDLKTSAVGNHEFDQGYDDLVNRVIGPDAAPNAAFDHLGANVYLKGTTTPALDEYALEEVDGLTVGIIGAITQETPSLVSPAGIADLDFGDPVDAVNRVAAALTDGDEANGEADVIIASYHEGAGAGTPDGATLEEEVAAGGAFADIVTDTSAAVDVIFTGHTHKQYAWDAPIPGTDGETRPVLQTGSYGENIGNVVLELDPSSGDVISYSAKNVARTTTADAELVAAYQRVAEVKTITDTALAAAAVVGNEPVGSVSADITTAFSGGSYVDGKYTGGIRDDRASESALGNLVANSLVSSLGTPERGGATIGVVNPGGLRAELSYAGDTSSNTENTDGVVTFAEANAVLPFVNNLWTTSLTGAQFKSVLEQQWQTNPDGTIPSRPFQKLGLSDNVQYTYDGSRAQGDRITGIWVDGEPIDAATSYRIGTFSFLTSGGDNFREFTNGADARDSGLIDRDAWISYLKANPGLTPSFARHAAEVKNVPTAPVSTGSTLTFDVSGLDLTSLGSQQNSTLTASWTGSAATFEQITVANGAASVALPVPLDAPAASELVLTAAPSGTVVHVPVTVSPGTTPEPEKPSTPPVDVPEDQLTQDLFGTISVSPDVVAPGGSVTVFVGSEHAGEWVSVWLYSTPQLLGDGWQQVSTNGGVTVTIPADTPPGTHKIAVLDASGDLLGWTSVTVTGVPDGSAGTGSGDLASTGATVFPWLALAMLLLAAGAGAVVVRRRRSQA